MKGMNVCRSVAKVMGTASLATLVWGNAALVLNASEAQSTAPTQATLTEEAPALASLNATVSDSSPSSLPVQASMRTGLPLATVVPHAWHQNQLGVTLRINQIPVVTLVGTATDLQTLANHQPLTTPNNALSRAEAIANQINQLAQLPGFDPNHIRLDLNPNTRQYTIKLGDIALLPLDQTTILPERRLGKQQTAVQITNRLRRLLGGAEPIAALPSPSQMVNVENSDTYTSLNRINGGMASWYGPGFHGRRTANGERFNQYALTAAHKSLPFGTRVKVTNLNNGKSVIVRINDRGPYAHGRVIDLSKGAAKAIGVHNTGVARVTLDILR